MTNHNYRLITGIFCIIAAAAHGAREAVQLSQLIASSDAICQATATANQSFEKAPNNHVFTASGFAVSEFFKGVFNTTVRMEHRGGKANGRGEHFCGQPKFDEGKAYLLFIGQRDDGTLYCLHSVAETESAYAATLEQLRQQSAALAETGMDVSEHEAESFMETLMGEGLLPATAGVSSRFLQCDRGEPIEYVVDMDAWPAGITSNQALTAIANAFEAWSDASSLTFECAGIESFGMAAPDLTNYDGRIYIQLHDNHGFINSPGVLGRGGRAWSYSSNWPDGGLGGRVGTNEFDVTIQGHLVIEHGATELSTLARLEEVLCHELGHVLSLDHSSEAEDETNSVLKDATMYYLAHFDGRGASVREWDTNTVITAYPAMNTPPYGYDRIIRALNSPDPQAPVGSGVNQVEFPSYDLQGGATPTLVSSTSVHGMFSIENTNTVFFAPYGWYGDSPELGDGAYYDQCYVRMSDGVNLSPPINVRIVQLVSDFENPPSHPNNWNHVPNTWEGLHGVSGASEDPDGDNLTNQEEWLLDTAPTDPLSRLKVEMTTAGLSWNSRANDLYQVQSTTNLMVGFSNEGVPVQASSTNETYAIGSQPQKFYRVQRLK